MDDCDPFFPVTAMDSVRTSLRRTGWRGQSNYGRQHRTELYRRDAGTTQRLEACVTTQSFLSLLPAVSLR